MKLFDRYINGETTKVYDELSALREGAFNSNNFIQTDLILKETFRRVKFNLDIIYNALKNIDYKFVSTIQYNWQIPVLPPDPNVDLLLFELKSKLKNAGHIPLSLEYFYRIVGSCNFCWDWKVYPDIPWVGADPIDIPPIRTLLTDLIYDDYDINEILLSGDYLQKDNISGSCYNLELTTSPSIDSLLIGWDIPFIDYLRLTFKNCGFTMADQCEYDTLAAFCNFVRPQMLEI
ncbi:hypothetical protein [Emticicia sp. BO119]|uniref:hypothetical protein n=1 Tax=Emticicia sp. BO119 TaxID=2757768 RepID=UPI0015F0C237|nr:hypothetical protein [Emticicia sp. BO119]MBA4851457.1 hypothetical protein [Emticicia sp. BO119]